jgi:hypothetical protein
MPENPCEPHNESQNPRKDEYAYPYRVVEWIVMILIALVALALLLPVVRF